MSKPEITIVWDDQSVEVFCSNGKRRRIEAMFIDKESDFEAVAKDLQNLLNMEFDSCELVHSDEFY